jgi:hypothetical protein
MYMEIRIYALIDPQTNEVRYVGKTKRTLRIRLRAHINDNPKHNTHKFNWIKMLKSDDIEPIIVELEVCNENNWIEREKYWIKQYNNLTNLTTGGEGCDYFTVATQELISRKVKRAWENEEYRNNISKQRSLYWSDEKNREAHSKKLEGRKISEEQKLSMSNCREDCKPIIINGIKYKSIKGACKLIPINRQTLKRRLMSKKFPEYTFEELSNTVQSG